jgi:hypothetical protein
MAKRKSVALPNYPAILLAPVELDNPVELQKCMDALAVHYHLNPPFGGFYDASSQEELLRRWIDLTVRLLSDFVPAFRVRRKGGAPKQPHTQIVWQHPHAHEARLVQIVIAFRKMLHEKDMPSTNRDAFKEVLRNLKQKPAPMWRFGRMTAVSALEQAWKAIPAAVKANPDSYLPHPHPRADGGVPGFNVPEDVEKHPSADSALGFGFLSPLSPPSRAERALWRDLPHIPEKLKGSRT